MSARVSVGDGGRVIDIVFENYSGSLRLSLSPGSGGGGGCAAVADASGACVCGVCA
jgi:hypothetical protein